MRLFRFVAACFLQAVVVAPSQAQSDRQLQKVYDALDEMCRDGAGTKTSKACDTRDEVGQMLKNKQAVSGATTPWTAPNAPADIGQRAALLVASPMSIAKFTTFTGRVVWTLENASKSRDGTAVPPSVEADVEVPGDKMKVEVVFKKNTDATLPAAQVVNVHFKIEPGSPSGSVKRVGVLQMRAASMSGGKSLAGAAVPITINWYMIGLAPGKSEAANSDFIRRLEWIDIPIQLENGRTAKLTFEKGASGTRDLNAAFDAWAKQ